MTATDTIKVGDCTLDRNYGRVNVVLARTERRVLVALRRRTNRRRTGAAVYQLRWRPIEDIRTTPAQCLPEAVNLAVAAIRHKGGVSNGLTPWVAEASARTARAIERVTGASREDFLCFYYLPNLAGTL